MPGSVEALASSKSRPKAATLRLATNRGRGASVPPEATSVGWPGGSNTTTDESGVASSSSMSVPGGGFTFTWMTQPGRSTPVAGSRVLQAWPTGVGASFSL